MTRRNRILAALAVLIALPLAASALAVATREQRHWSASRWDSAGFAPDPAQTTEAVVQVYAARVWGWRAAFGVHTWIAVKPEGAASYTRYDVVAWSRPVIRARQGVPDGFWAGNKPELLRDIRGPAAADLIPRIEAAIAAYPHKDEYQVWPGPNSNTFVAHIGRNVPTLDLHLPPTAVGKDYLPGGSLVDQPPSGQGMQVSLFGLLGATVGPTEGVELNLLGLTIGVDVLRPALKLPGIGRIGLPVAVAIDETGS